MINQHIKELANKKIPLFNNSSSLYDIPDWLRERKFLHIEVLWYPHEWLFVILICFLIAAMEMINTAIEATIDLITTEVNPLAKIAKDTASSSTLLLCISAFIGGLVIFIPKIIALF